MKKLVLLCLCILNSISIYSQSSEAERKKSTTCVKAKILTGQLILMAGAMTVVEGFSKLQHYSFCKYRYDGDCDQPYRHPQNNYFIRLNNRHPKFTKLLLGPIATLFGSALCVAGYELIDQGRIELIDINEFNKQIDLGKK